MQEHVITVRPGAGPTPTDAMLEELAHAGEAIARGEGATLRIERGVAPEIAAVHVYGLKSAIRAATKRQREAAAAPKPAPTPHLAQLTAVAITAQDLRAHLAGCTDPTCPYRAIAGALGVK
ncbi:MAG: hypothetical protein KIT58_00065 [Planctomycetota bacterium]|nr:hypothetical protein [Planctomycetota bacterium]